MSHTNAATPFATPDNGQNWLVQELIDLKFTDVGMKWRKRRDGRDGYELWSVATGAVASVWKSIGKSWGGTSGNSAPTLKAMKAQEEDYRREGLMLLALSLFPASKRVATAAADTANYPITPLAKKVFTELLNRKLAVLVREALDQKGQWSYCDKNARYGNAFLAIDHNQRKLCFLEAGLNFSGFKTDMKWRLDTLAIRTCMDIDTGSAWETDRAYGEDGARNVVCPSWYESDLQAAVEKAVDYALTGLNRKLPR
jgi:hypothetical protein